MWFISCYEFSIGVWIRECGQHFVPCLHSEPFCDKTSVITNFKWQISNSIHWHYFKTFFEWPFYIISNRIIESKFFNTGLFLYRIFINYDSTIKSATIRQCQIHSIYNVPILLQNYILHYKANFYCFFFKVLDKCLKSRTNILNMSLFEMNDNLQNTSFKKIF